MSAILMPTSGPPNCRNPRLLDVDAVVAPNLNALTEFELRGEVSPITIECTVSLIGDAEVGEHVVRIVVRLRLMARQLVAREDRVPAAHRVVHAPEREVFEDCASCATKSARPHRDRSFSAAAV